MTKPDPTMAQEIARVGLRVRGETDRPRPAGGGRRAQRGDAGHHAARGPVAGRAGPGPHARRGRPRCRNTTGELFAGSFADLRREIKRITGVEVREAAAEIEPATGTVVKAFTTGTVVQVFLLADGVPADAWRGGTGSPTLTRGDRPCG